MKNKNENFADLGGQNIVTTVVPLGPDMTHTICPYCHAEIDTATKTEPGMIAYISGALIALLGYANWNRLNTHVIVNKCVI